MEKFIEAFNEISNKGYNKFYKTLPELEEAINNTTLEQIQNRLEYTDAQQVKDDYEWLKGKNLTIGLFKMENFFLVCLKEILDNQGLFAVATKSFIPVEPIKSFFKVRSVARYLDRRFYEKNPLYMADAKETTTTHARIASINTVLLIQKNHYLVAKHFNSIYLHDFTLLKDNKVDNVLTKVIEEIMNGDSENSKEHVPHSSKELRP